MIGDPWSIGLMPTHLSRKPFSKVPWELITTFIEGYVINFNSTYLDGEPIIDEDADEVEGNLDE